MSKYLVTINGVNYEVEVAEAGTISPSAAAAPAAAPAAPCEDRLSGSAGPLL